MSLLCLSSEHLLLMIIRHTGESIISKPPSLWDKCDYHSNEEIGLSRGKSSQTDTGRYTEPRSIAVQYLQQNFILAKIPCLKTIAKGNSTFFCDHEKIKSPRRGPLVVISIPSQA